jgi:hypothetical protein
MIGPNTAYPVVKTQYFEKQRQDQDMISIRCAIAILRQADQRESAVCHWSVDHWQGLEETDVRICAYWCYGS